jgi:prepilin-type N-terminal cleavage/methylation domain-containing protein
MSFNNIKTKLRQERGFTIVELLIVIVVIGILAAITIVAYNGVTSRANTTKSVTAAENVQKKAEAFNADTAGTAGTQSGNGYYPATAAIFAAVPNTFIGSVTGVSIVPTTTTISDSTKVQYVACAPTAGASTADGYFVGYYDYSKSQVVWVSGGSVASTPAAGSAPVATNCAASGRAISST